jgi:hypothetical protein
MDLSWHWRVEPIGFKIVGPEPGLGPEPGTSRIRVWGYPTTSSDERERASDYVTLNDLIESREAWKNALT